MLFLTKYLLKTNKQKTPHSWEFKWYYDLSHFCHTRFVTSYEPQVPEWNRYFRAVFSDILNPFYVLNIVHVSKCIDYVGHMIQDRHNLAGLEICSTGDT